jgi:transposase
MAKREQFTLTSAQRHNRHFSEEFKRQKVQELEQKIVTIPELCKEYELSRTSIYLWIHMYFKKFKKGEQIRVEAESDTRKIQELRKRIEDLERIVGQKQLLIDFQARVIDLAEEQYKVDIKKKLGDKLFSGTGLTERNTK